MTDETTPITEAPTPETPVVETPVVETPTPETTPGTLAAETPAETPAEIPGNEPGVAATPKAAAAGPIGNAEFHDQQVGVAVHAKATNEATKILDAIKAAVHHAVASFEHDEEVTVADIKKLIERVTGDHTAVKGEDTTTVVKSPTA